MAKTYERAPEAMKELLSEIMERFHPELHDAGITVDLLVCRSDSEDGSPALTSGGYPCFATVRITPLKDRAKGCSDAEIVLREDFDTWHTVQASAIFDHELTHLELAIDKYGKMKRDDLGRPKLTMRLHDRQLGWFDCVARRWGVDAIESQQAAELFRSWEFVDLYLQGVETNEIGSVLPVTVTPES